MSYILDALRKADAERERGVVPGLHTQTAPALPGDMPSRVAVAPAAWVIGGAVLIGAGVLAWSLGGNDGSRDNALHPVVQAPAPAVAPTPVATAPVTTPAPMAPAPVAPAPLALAPRQAPVDSVVATRHHPAPLLGAARPVAAAKASESAAAERVYAVHELPDDVRRAMPSLSVGGSIYSATPASRFLIINGQIFHEGDRVATDLSLEQIKLKAAVLRFRGYRVGISY